MRISRGTFEISIQFNTVGEVAKRSNAADCKSVALAASKVRVLPSPPSFARDCDRARELRRAGPGYEVKRMARLEAGLPAGSARCDRAEPGGGSNSVVESQPSKLLVAGSIPVSRSNLRSRVGSRARASVGRLCSLSLI